MHKNSSVTGNFFYLKFNVFVKKKLKIKKKFFFDIEDSFLYHNGMMFSTKENDNDKTGTNCAATYGNGWWFNACHHSNLNGIYYKKATASASGMAWHFWHNLHKWVSLKSSKMMIKPK